MTHNCDCNYIIWRIIFMMLCVNLVFVLLTTLWLKVIYLPTYYYYLLIYIIIIFSPMSPPPWPFSIIFFCFVQAFWASPKFQAYEEYLLSKRPYIISNHSLVQYYWVCTIVIFLLRTTYTYTHTYYNTYSIKCRPIITLQRVFVPFMISTFGNVTRNWK